MRGGRWALAGVVAALLGGGAVAAIAQAPAPTPAPAARAGTKVGFIDLRRVMVRSAAGVAAREQLERERAAMQKEMDTRRQELERLRDDLEKKGTLMTPEARRERQDLYERKRRDAARLADDLARELTKKEQTAVQKVLEQVVPVIQRYGREHGYDLILERRDAGIVYATTDVDLTDEIIRAFDQQAGAKGKP